MSRGDLFSFLYGKTGPFIVVLFVIYNALSLLNVPRLVILSLKKSSLSIDFIFSSYFALFNVKNDLIFGIYFVSSEGRLFSLMFIYLFEFLSGDGVTAFDSLF